MGNRSNIVQPYALFISVQNYQNFVVSLYNINQNEQGVYQYSGESEEIQPNQIENAISRLLGTFNGIEIIYNNNIEVIGGMKREEEPDNKTLPISDIVHKKKFDKYKNPEEPKIKKYKVPEELENFYSQPVEEQYDSPPTEGEFISPDSTQQFSPESYWSPARITSSSIPSSAAKTDTEGSPVVYRSPSLQNLDSAADSAATSAATSNADSATTSAEASPERKKTRLDSPVGGKKKGKKTKRAKKGKKARKTKKKRSNKK